MSAMEALFQPGGRTYRTIPDAISLLPKGLQHAATIAWTAIMRSLARDELDERATDARFAEETGWSKSTIQKGLNALDRKMVAIGQKALIHRESGRGHHGRRSIVPAPLAGRGRRKDDDPRPDPPPAPPPVDRKDTSTDGKSSSSSIDPALIDRAKALIPEATTERVAAAAAAHPPNWLARALDQVEARNARPGNKPVRAWVYVLRTLDNWTKEGGPPAKAQEQRPRPSPSPAKEPPRAPDHGPRLTPDELADLIGRCRSPEPITRRFAQAQARIALRDGLALPGEIPPDLLE